MDARRWLSLFANAETRTLDQIGGVEEVRGAHLRDSIFGTRESITNQNVCN
jgi:hypothetical protein